MATNSSISVTEGIGKNIATHSISETTTKELQRMELNNSNGTEIATASNPIRTDPTGSTIQPISGTVTASNTAGDVASGATDSGNPVKLGYVARSSEATAVTNAQRVSGAADLTGKQIVLPYANPENFVNGTTTAIIDTTSTSTIAAQGAGVRNYITSIIVTNSHATVGTFVKILDGASIIWEGYAAAVGGGFTCSFPTPLRGTANTAVNTQAVTTGANVIASVAGYKGI